MENYFVHYEQALALKELGFNETCFGGYLKDTGELWIGYVKSQGGEQFNREYHILAPLYQQVFKFFRERHNPLEHTIIRISDQPYDKGKIRKYLGHIWLQPHQRKGLGTISSETYKEAEIGCLKKLIEIAQKENK